MKKTQAFLFFFVSIYTKNLHITHIRGVFRVIHKRWGSFMVRGLGSMWKIHLFFIVFVTTSGIIKTGYANVQFSKKLKEKIISSKPFSIPLTKIIEVFLASQDDEEFSYFFSSIINNTIDIDKNDTRVGLAHKWIENSTNHIFNDPYRAPAEWVANALDATVAKKEIGTLVGKFGLGFFSGLCFLLHQEEFWPNTNALASLSITTSTHNDDAYQVILTKTLGPKDISITFSALDSTQKKAFFQQLHTLDPQDPKTGTLITLLPPEGYTLSDAMIAAIQSYFHYFDVYPHVTTIVDIQNNNQKRSHTLIGGHNNAPSISVSLTPQKFSVLDAGTGIPLETMIFSLLVPSNSTKKASEPTQSPQTQEESQENHLPKYINFLGKKDKNQSHFLITVNGIVVIDKILNTPIFDDNNSLKDIIISMPQKTRLTVARNELYIDPHAVSFEETYIKNVIDITIEHCFSTAKEQSLLLSLYKSLSCWENHSSAQHIKGLFSSYFKQKLELAINQHENLIPVPLELYASSILKAIEQDSTRIFPLDPELVCYTYQKAENFLTNAIKNKNAIAIKGKSGALIAGKKVFFVNISHITNLGLRNCLFVPEDFLEKRSEQEVVNIVSACVTDQDLLSTSHQQYVVNTLLITNKNHSWSDIPNYCSNMQNLYELVKSGQTPFNTNDENLLKEIFIKNFEIFSDAHLWQKAFYLYNFDLSSFFVDSWSNGAPYRKTIMNLNVLTQGICDRASLFSINNFQETISKFQGFFFDPETEMFYRFKHNDLYSIGQKIQDLLQKTNTISLDIKRALLETNACEKVSICDLANTYATIIGLLAGVIKYNEYGFSYSTAETYFTGGVRLWPLEKKQENITAFFTIFACFAAEHYLKNSSHKKIPYFFDYNQHPAVKHFLEHLRQGTGSIILSFPGYSQEELKTLMNICEPDYIWAKSLQPYLARSFTAINIPGYIEEIIGWLLRIVGPHSTIDTDIQKKVIDLKSSLLGLYQRFFTVDFSLFPHTYGQEIIFKALQGEHDIINSNEAIYTLIQSLSHEKTVLNKLFTLIVTDFSLKMDSEKQRQDLIEQNLYVPIITSNTPLSLLAALKETLKNGNLADKIITIIIEKSRSVQELAFMSYIFLNEHILTVLRTLDPERHEEFTNICGYLFTHYIQEKIDPRRLDELYEKNRKTISLKDRIANINDEIVGTLVKQYIQERAAQQEPPWGHTTTVYNDAILSASAPRNTILLTQLLKAHCAGTGIYDLLKQEKLQQVLTKTKTLSSQTNLGKINQSVEAGSEKSALTATLVECLQNAIDAANYVYKKTGNADMINTIVFTLETMKKPRENKCALCLSIKDYVGFDRLVTLLTDFLLPDFSNKASQNGTIGTMGNGSFKMYQQAQSVSIVTRIKQTKHCFHLVITPLRYEHNKQVYDLRISCKDITKSIDDTFVGTDIKVTFLDEPEDVIRMNLLSIRDFLTTTIGATHACLTGSSIPFVIYERDRKGSLHRINQKTESSDVIYEWKEHGQTLFKILKRSSPYLQSYVTTAGLPFVPFSTINNEKKLLTMPMSNNMNMGYIVDLALTTYKPVQSRTTIQMNNDMIKKLRMTIHEAYYIVGLKRATQKLAQKDNTYAIALFEHLASCTHDFYQVSLNNTDNSRASSLFTSILEGENNCTIIPEKLFFTYYKPYSLHELEQQSFFDYIQDGYTNLVACLKHEQLAIEKTAQARYQEWLSAYKKIAETEILATQNDNEQDAIIERWIKQFEQWFNASQYHDEWEKTKNDITKNYFLQKHETIQQTALQAYFIENDTYGLVDTIVKTWFLNKIDSIGIRLPSLRLASKDHSPKQEPNDSKTQTPRSIFVSNKEKKEKQNIQEQSKELFNRLGWPDAVGKKIGKALNCLIEQFCKTHAKLLGTKDIATTCIYDESDTLAFFNSYARTITINFSSMSIVAYLMLLAKIVSCDPTQNDIHTILYDEAYTKYFAPQNAKAPVILHELEHARRDDPQNKEQTAPHTQAKDPQGNIVDFDACANAYATVAYKNNLTFSWINGVRKNVSYDIRKSIEKIMTDATIRNILQTLEEKNKEYLAQKLGLA